MVANTDNALLFLVTAVLKLALAVFLLRVLLQLVRADFYNPVSQVVYRLTRPVVMPLSRVLRTWRRIDLAGCLVLFLLGLVYVFTVASLLPLNIGWLKACWFAVLEILSMAIYIYTLSLFAMAVLSWVGPGVNNPAANVLWSLNEPLLRPVRRLPHTVAGLDLSPIPVMLILMTLDRLLPLGPFR